MSTQPIPTPFDTPLPGEVGSQPVRPRAQVATPFDAPLPGEPSTATGPLNDLVLKIRAKYPGAYDDMDDATLTKAVLAKYPQYSDLAAPKVQPPQVNMQQDPWGIQDNPNQAGAGLPGMTGNRPVTGKDLIPGAVAGGAAAAVAAPSVIGSLVAGSPVLRAIGNWGLGAAKIGAGVAAEEELRKYIKKQLGLTK